jgi:hypothetical protein
VAGDRILGPVSSNLMAPFANRLMLRASKVVLTPYWNSLPSTLTYLFMLSIWNNFSSLVKVNDFFAKLVTPVDLPINTLGAFTVLVIVYKHYVTPLDVPPVLRHPEVMVSLYVRLDTGLCPCHMTVGDRPEDYVTFHH